MGCNDQDNNVPPANDLTVTGTTSDARILQALNDAGASLKQAGVSQLKILDWGAGGGPGPVEIIPLGGNRADVDQALDAVRDDLQAAGYKAQEGPAFRCAGSSNELRVSRPGATR